MPDDEPELAAYLKINTSADLPYLVRQAALGSGMANSSDWVRDVIIRALVEQDGALDAQDLYERQPHWGNGRGATSPEYIAKRYGRPWPPEKSAEQTGG